MCSIHFAQLNYAPEDRFSLVVATTTSLVASKTPFNSSTHPTRTCE
jgi:hypothetical protein